MKQFEDFNLTILESATLVQRLSIEVRFAFDQLRRWWPELKNDPLNVGRAAAIELTNSLRRSLFTRNALAGFATAFFLIASTFSLLLVLGGTASKTRAAGNLIDETSDKIVMLDISASVKPTGAGVGINGKGRVGIDHAQGEGSEAAAQRSQGGGSGGDGDQKPAQHGSLPPPSIFPALINPPLPNAVLPVAGIDIDPALWRNLPFPTPGDPRSKSTVASKGEGEGGGIGTNKGLGVGDGRGNGFGPGDDGNTGGGPKSRGGGGPGSADGNDPADPNRIVRQDELTERARVLFKPEPQYTEEARRTDITGSVVLRVVFSSTGEVTNIRAIKTLPAGLTEKAVAAARQIRFVPAMKDGHAVSTYMQLEYNFNLY